MIVVGSMTFVTTIAGLCFVVNARLNKHRNRGMVHIEDVCAVHVDCEPTVNPAGPFLSAETPLYPDTYPPAYESLYGTTESPPAYDHVCRPPHASNSGEFNASVSHVFHV